MKTINKKLNQVGEVLRATNGTVFSVKFIKRTTGEERLLVGRLGVAKNLTGKGLAFDPADKALTVVYDFQKKAYRMINLETVISIHSKKVLYTFK